MDTANHRTSFRDRVLEFTDVQCCPQILLPMGAECEFCDLHGIECHDCNDSRFPAFSNGRAHVDGGHQQRGGHVGQTPDTRSSPQ
jgi:hypothetical protein